MELKIGVATSLFNSLSVKLTVHKQCESQRMSIIPSLHVHCDMVILAIHV